MKLMALNIVGWWTVLIHIADHIISYAYWRISLSWFMKYDIHTQELYFERGYSDIFKCFISRYDVEVYGYEWHRSNPDTEARILMLIVADLGSSKKEIKWYAILVIVMKCMYVMLAMIRRPICVASTLQNQPGITGSDWCFALIGYLLVGLLTAPVLAVLYIWVKGLPRYFNKEVGEIEVLVVDITDETGSEIKVSSETNITSDNVTVFVKSNDIDSRIQL